VKSNPSTYRLLRRGLMADERRRPAPDCYSNKNRWNTTATSKTTDDICSFLNYQRSASSKMN